MEGKNENPTERKEGRKKRSVSGQIEFVKNKQRKKCCGKCISLSLFFLSLSVLSNSEEKDEEKPINPRKRQSTDELFINILFFQMNEMNKEYH